MRFGEMMELEPHGPDTYVGTGPQYPWGGLYGGQIVAQALRAAGLTIEPAFHPHSLHAYFIRPGDDTEPIRFEVDRDRNGRSFCTRRVVARQSIGVILNMAASFQVDEDAPDRQGSRLPDVPRPADVESDSWSELFERRFPPRGSRGVGRSSAWLRLHETTGPDRLLTACAIAYLSDDLPTESVFARHPDWDPSAAVSADEPYEQMLSASLDHAIWFHRDGEPGEWQLHDFTCDELRGARGLARGNVFAEDGTQLATVNQEVLIRRRSR